MCIKNKKTSCFAIIMSYISIIIGRFLNRSTNIVIILYFVLFSRHFLKLTVMCYYSLSDINNNVESLAFYLTTRVISGIYNN
jgi:hypothetical protein